MKNNLELQIFLFEYKYDGEKYVFEIPAFNKNEALERFKLISTGEHIGILDCEIKILPEILNNLN